MSEEEKKSAVDILIELDKKATLILGLCKNFDNNMKMVLGRVNELSNKINSNQNQQPVKAYSNTNSETIVIPKRNESSPKNNTPIIEQKMEDSKPFSISQVVQKSDGTPIKLAGIEIKDSEGNIIHQTRALANGKYNVPNVVAGSYNVRVFKHNGGKGKPLDFVTKVQISPPELGNVVELTPLIIPLD